MLTRNGLWKLRPADGASASIVIAGDCFPHKSAEDYIQQGHGKELLSSIRPVLDSADLRIIQWETVVTTENTPIIKAGPNLAVAPETARLLEDGHFNIALLANNHTGDHGPHEVLRTLKELKKRGILTVGAGADAKKAAKPLHFEKNGLQFSLLNACEMEFGTALAGKAGANAMDEYALREQISAECAAGFLVIVVTHGGNEYNPIPSPLLKKRSRSFADAGAALVMNIHTHCPQGIEVWNQVPIVYSPGNFFFPKSPFEVKNFWWSGYLPKFTFDARGVASLEITPYMFSPDPWKITALEGKARAWYLDYLNRISRLLLTDGDRLYDIWTVYRMSMPLNWIKNAPAEKLERDPEDPDALKALPGIRHMLTCQAHNELARNMLLMIEEKRISAAKAQLPELEELRTARFAESGNEPE